MNRRILLFALVSLLAGCSTASKTSGLGSHAPGTSAATYKKMAGDVATKMTALYPPARSKLLLSHISSDAFGACLVDALRKQGYALSESVPSRPAAPVKNTATGSDLNLSYVVDQPLDTGQIRVTVFINTQSLSRLYQPIESGVAAAGYWMRKE